MPDERDHPSKNLQETCEALDLLRDALAQAEKRGDQLAIEAIERAIVATADAIDEISVNLDLSSK